MRRRDTWLHQLAQASMIAVFAMILSVTVYRAVRPTPFDPLRFSPQNISDHVTGRSDASVHNGQSVHVLANKCSLKKTTTNAVRFWVEVSPPRLIVKDGAGVAHYPGPNSSYFAPGATTGRHYDSEGCAEYAFTDPMPAAVVAENRYDFAHGYAAVVWMQRGEERPRHSHGVLETWETNNVIVVP